MPSAIPLHYSLALSLGFGYVSYMDTVCNRIVTVPKSFKTHRTIAAEPEGAMPFQLAFDGYVKRRLRKVGVDLRKQGPNQEMAREASLAGSDEHATLDLSMASDTLAYNTVAWLLPQEWFEYVNRVRCPQGAGFDKIYMYEKFSSMGNGTTFGLESLVFAAFCTAVGCKPGDYRVYGDDIIVPNAVVSRLMALLKFFGFQLNKEKSFTTGLFRESCGADWFDGIDVTPKYVDLGDCLKVDFVHFVNSLASVAHPEGQLWSLLLKLVIERNLPLVPFNESSISGVWVTPRSAYAEEILKTRRRHLPVTRLFVNLKKGGVQNRNVARVVGKIMVDELRHKAFVPKTSNLNCPGFPSYALWHLDALRRQAGKKPHTLVHPWMNQYKIPDLDQRYDPSCIIRSKVPLFERKYTSKWVVWNPPNKATPLYLHWWSESLIRALAPKSDVEA